MGVTETERVRIHVGEDTHTSDSAFDPISIADGLDLMEADKGGTTVNLPRDFAFSLFAPKLSLLYSPDGIKRAMCLYFRDGRIT